MTPAGPTADNPPWPCGARPSKRSQPQHVASSTGCHPHPFPPEQGDKLPLRKLRLITHQACGLHSWTGSHWAHGPACSALRRPWWPEAGLMSMARGRSLRMDGPEGRGYSHVFTKAGGKEMTNERKRCQANTRRCQTRPRVLGALSLGGHASSQFSEWGLSLLCSRQDGGNEPAL